MMKMEPDEVRPDGTDDKKLYENLDMIAGNLDSDELTAEILMTIMGLVWQDDSERVVPGPASYVLNPDLRDRSTRIMYRWLTAHGFLPAPRNRPHRRHPNNVG